ncbi:MAG: TPM domain-containing protein [Caulobacter sp.]|nr:TPM domain-containing protein [Caulobacter sp.]
MGRIFATLMALTILLIALPALAAPTFPPLTGRVVDNADILSPAVEASLTDKLAGLETSSGHQLVVVTLPSLQGYEIEDYGYQLGRTWAIGDKKINDGALLIVAPNERKVRVEVGYGLEGVLTDALSSVIIQSAILPKFKAGDMEGGVVAGTDALVQQLSLPDDQARAKATAAASTAREHKSSPPIGFIIFLIVFWIIIASLRGRRGRGGLASALPWIILGSMGGGGGRDSGGWGGGGGGFSGGGGSFGGGGSSGSW